VVCVEHNPRSHVTVILPVGMDVGVAVIVGVDAVHRGVRHRQAHAYKGTARLAQLHAHYWHATDGRGGRCGGGAGARATCA